MPALLARHLYALWEPGQGPVHPREQGPHCDPSPAVAPLGNSRSSMSKPSRRGRTDQRVALCGVPGSFPGSPVVIAVLLELLRLLLLQQLRFRRFQGFPTCQPHGMEHPTCLALCSHNHVLHV